LYDENGRAYGFIYNGSPYYYYFNLQGDVTYLMGTYGGWRATYTYDEWGNLISVSGDTSLANLNPIRYRGYYYDSETSFYYLRSRYYDPEICRFINADSVSYLGADGAPLGYNLFAYCSNNPVNFYDPSGTNGEAVLGGWMGSMWWLSAIDSVLPIGDIVYWGGIVILGSLALEAAGDADPLTLPNEADTTDDTLNGSEVSKDEYTDKDTSKSSDKNNRLKGKPGDISKDGYRETKIGDDGKASKERHHTDHGYPKKHTNPHDHDITWTDEGHPQFGPPQNYWDGKIPIF